MLDKIKGVAKRLSLFLFGKVGSNMKDFIYTLMREDHANSRFAYLIQSIAVAIVILLVGWGFVHTPTSSGREGYDIMMCVLLGGGGVGTIARGWQKRQTGGTETTGNKEGQS